MNHWMIFPVLIPMTTAALTVLTSRFDLVLARVFSVAATVLMLLVSMILFQQTYTGETFVYRLGGWPAQFGIALLLDRLSAAMLLLSGLLGFAISLAAIDGWDRKGRNFHPIFLMQLAGINCAFLAGDLFNLFVAFEVMLIASYGLMVHSGGQQRLQAGIQFVVINLCGSTVFLFGLGLIYSAVGGLNMADVGSRMPEMASGNRAMMSAGLVMLMVVFALKAGLFPFHFWLPTAYSYAPPLVAALFAIATKVGIHSMIRVHSQIIAPNQDILSPWITSWLVPAALITIVIGMVGALGSRRLGQMASYATLASSGTIMVAIGQFQDFSFSAGLYYLFHSTLAGAAIFLIIDAIAQRRGRLNDQLTVAAPMPQVGLLGGLFLIIAAAMAGMPPFSGFIGKVFILLSIQSTDLAVWIWSVILATSLLGIFAFARAGSTLFWKSSTVETDQAKPINSPLTAMTLVATGWLLLLLIGLTVAAGLAIEMIDQMGAQIWGND